MKKTSVLLMMATSLILIDVPVPTLASTSTTKTAEVSAIGRKKKGYKPKRGGLFNTGLFRKKNSCGCPNH